jgi:hypothetical protein
VGHIDAFVAECPRNGRGLLECVKAINCNGEIRGHCWQSGKAIGAYDLRISGDQLSLIPELPKESSRCGLYKCRFR